MKVSLVDKAKNIIVVLVLLVGWAVLETYLLSLVNGVTVPVQHHTWTLKYLVYGCILAPLWEEMAFRKLPFTIVEELSNHNTKVLWATIGLTSIVFGWEHGNGTDSLLMQGVIGFMIAIVYVENGFCYWSAVTTHAAWNALCMYLPLQIVQIK